MAGEDSRYRSRRFLFAAGIMLVATLAAAYFGWKWGAESSEVMDVLRWWRDVAGMVLALYGISSFAEKKVTLGKGEG